MLGFYIYGTPYINIRALDCARARLFTGLRVHRPQITETTSGAMSTLLHEALHRQGIPGGVDEQLTECYADTATKFAGWDAWYQFVPGTSDQVWSASEKWGDLAMQLAFQYTRHSVAASYYVPKDTCLRAVYGSSGVTGISWADFLRARRR